MIGRESWWPSPSTCARRSNSWRCWGKRVCDSEERTTLAEMRLRLRSRYFQQIVTFRRNGTKREWQRSPAGEVKPRPYFLAHRRRPGVQVDIDGSLLSCLQGD